MVAIEHDEGLVVQYTDRQAALILRARALRMVEQTFGVPQHVLSKRGFYRYNPGLEQSVEERAEALLQAAASERGVE